MKVEIEREKLLSNFEVYQHLKDIQTQHNWNFSDNTKKSKRNHNPDLELVTRELTSYFSKTNTSSQTVSNVSSIIKELSKYKLEKIELLQIINTTPHSLVNLYSIVEECDSRFGQDECEDMLELIQKNFPISKAEDEVMRDEDEEEEED